MIDIYHTRRTHYKRCVYYLRNEQSSIDPAKYVMQTKPSGVFFARPSNIASNRNSQVSNVFMTNEDNVTLETNDDIEDIKTGAIVEYIGDYWFVENIQKEIHNKETEFSNHQHSTTYLTIRK